MSLHLRQDVRCALRALRQHKVFSVTAVTTLAVAIGANTATFSVVNALLLKPLPYATPERLVAVREHREQTGFEQTVMARAEFLRWTRTSRTIEDAAAVLYPGLAIRIGDIPERVAGLSVSPAFFRLLGVSAVRGQVFDDADAAPGQVGVLLVSFALWQEKWGGDPSLVGRTLIVEGEPRTVVGILPRGFDFRGRVDAVIPLTFTAEDEANYGDHSLEVYGRLKPGISRQAAQAELSAIALPDQGPTNHQRGVALVPLHEVVVGTSGTPIVVLLGAVAFVLIIGCANIANLQLARGAVRRKEMAVRAALGAGRSRLLSQLVTENLVLAVIGGIAGVLFALWSIDALVALSPAGTPRLNEARIDGHVLLFSLMTTLTAGMLFGLAPAWQLSSTSLHDSLKQDLRAGDATRHRTLDVFVMSEAALALMLVAGAGLVIATFINLRAVRPGFDPIGVATAPVSIAVSKYPRPTDQQRFIASLVARVQAIPGVTAAGVVNALPLSGDNSSTSLTIEGAPPGDPAHWPNTNLRTVTPGYFAALHIPLVRGRALSESDTHDSPPVTLINQTMADRFWPGQNAIGRRFKRGRRPSPNTPWITVVGIVGDVRHSTLSEPPRQEMYVPFDQSPVDFVVLAVRSHLPPRALIKPLQTEIRTLDPDVPVDNLRPFADTIGASLEPARFEMVLITTFGVVALLLAAGGIYGVTTYAVAQRTREFGIRLALGAKWRDVAQLVMLHAFRVAAVGVSLGVLGAWAISHLIASLLYGVEPGDAVILGTTASGLTLVLLAACVVPARRAASVDPAVTLRAE
jgi:putative ABC transport system permease protein